MPKRAGFSLILAVLALSGCANGDDGASSIERTTTNIAGAGVVGYQRDTTGLCPAATAPDPGKKDVKRIVVLDTPALDATCAVGLWERVVGAVTLDGDRPQPAYLGYGVKKIPSVGHAGALNVDQIRALKPDLILGTAAPADAAAINTIAPTVFTAATAGGDWQQQFATAAHAMNRSQSGKAALAAFREKATAVGASLNAGQTQASVVRFTGVGIDVEGTNSFAGKILADAGVRRPQYQRGTSYPLSADELDKVEGDLIYAILAGKDGKKYGEKILRTDTWRDLSAATDKRVWAVDDAIWNGNALTAANTLLDDLKTTLNGYVNN